MELKHLNTAFDVKAVEEDGTFEGYASVFDVIDEGLDVVRKGCFADSVSRRKPKMLWQHFSDEVIGVYDEVREDDTGLYVKGRILTEVQKGAEALALLRAGAIDSMSIGYTVTDSEYAAENNRIRELKAVELYEVSLVTFPMLPAAKVTGVKCETPKELEKILRDAGFSRKQAKGICSRGFAAITELRDAVDEDGNTEGLIALTDQLKQLQEAIKNA